MSSVKTRRSFLKSSMLFGSGTALAAQTAVIAARSLGLDCLTTNGIHRGETQMFRLPKRSGFVDLQKA